MKSLMCLLREVLTECGDWCSVSTSRDLKTITARVEDEGLSFLTITLPEFGKDLEKGLDLGQAIPSLWTGWSKRGGLPRFLGGFLDLIFDRASGRLLDEPSVEAIRCVRQLTLMWAKIGLECSEPRREAALRNFIECEQEVRRADEELTPVRLEQFKRLGSLLWRDVLTRVDWEVYEGEVTPKHGPGTTADRLVGNQKYDQREWTERL